MRPARRVGLLAQWAPGPLWVPYLPHLALGVVARAGAAPGPRRGAPRAPDGPLLRLPRVARSPRFVRTVAIVAPWVFACAAFSFAVLPGETGGATVLLAGAGGALTLVHRRRGPAGGQAARGPAARSRPARSGSSRRRPASRVGIAALAGDSRALVLVAAPLFGVGYGCCLISGLTETERIAGAGELGATVSVFYALSYLGFAAPYVTDLLNGALGDRGALAALAAAALACLAVSAGPGVRRARPRPA